MLLANGKAISRFTNTFTRPETVLKDTAGTDYNFYNMGSSAQYYTYIFSSMTIVVGSGNTAPDVFDYAMDNQIDTLTVIASNGTNNNSTGSYANNYIGVFSKTFENNTESDIVVSEVGIMSASNLGTPYDKYFLLARDVIEPVTIAPGETYTFTMRIG